MRRAFLTASLVLLFAMGSARGQEPPTPPPPPHKPAKPEPPSPEQHRELRKKIQAMRMARLTQELDLDEAGAAKLFPLVNRHDEKVSGLMEDRAKAMKGLAVALHDGKTDDLGPLLDKLGEIEKAVHEADEANHKKVREILSPAQAAKFFLFHERFHDEVRGFLDDARRDDKVRAEKHAIERKERLAAGGRGETKAVLEKAQMALKRGQLDDALAILGNAIKGDPRDAGPYVLRAQVLAQKAQLDEALEDLARALELDPKAAEPRAVRAHVLMAKRDWKGAKEEAAWLVENDVRNPRSWTVRAHVALQAGDLASARADLDRAIELDPRFADAFRLRGDVRIQEGDLAGARNDLERAIELDPKAPDVERLKKKIKELGAR